MGGGAAGLGFVRDYLRILRSGAFMHSAYANRYLGSRGRLLFALPHYLWRGEAAGHVGNPFVDPALRDATGRRVGLAAVCRDVEGSVPASAKFDPAWYAARHLRHRPGTSPFLHFWRRGFDADLDPAPGFDIAFFKAVVAVYRPDKREFAFERMADGRVDFPRNEAELVARQDAFFASVAMSVVRREPSGSRFLVFVQAAHDYRHPFPPDREFDVLINIYDALAPGDLHQAEIVVAQNGTKTTAVRKLLADAPELLTRYEAVLFLDDDIEISGADVERLFQIFESQGLDLAQPSLTADSACAYAALKQPAAASGVRPVSMVEIMMPLISRRALLACGEAFSASVSGWGVDALLAKLVRERFGDTIALVADVVAAHERDVDLEEGALYRYLRGRGIEPAHVAIRHGTSPWPDAVRFIGPDQGGFHSTG